MKELDAGHVALGVEAEPAEDRVELMAAQRRDDGVGIEPARLLDRLRPDLDDGVAVERETFGLESLRAELCDHRRRRLMAARVGHRDEPHALGTRTRDALEILAVQIVAADQLEVIVPVMRLARNQGGLSGVPAVEEHLDPRRLERGHRLGVVRLAGRDLVEPRLLDAMPVEPAPGRLGQALPVDGAVVQDRDLGVGPLLREVVAGEPGLLGIPIDHPEHVPQALLGQLRIGGAGGDHDDAGLLVQLGRRDRGPRAEVARDEHDAGRDQLARRRDALLGVAVVVGNDQLDRLAEQAAGRVELGDRHRDPALVLLAEPRHRARHRRPAPIRTSARASENATIVRNENATIVRNATASVSNLWPVIVSALAIRKSFMFATG